MTIPIFDLSVRCGFFCQGGSPQFDQTEYPDNYSVVKYPDHLAALQRERECREKLVEALEKSLATITDKRIGTVGYMEGSRIYMDFADSAKVINDALLAAKELEG